MCPTLYTHVGVSLVDTERACRNAEVEIPDFASSFEYIQSAAEQAWRNKLSPISLNATGVSMDMK